MPDALMLSAYHKLNTLKKKISFELIRDAKLQIYLCCIISSLIFMWLFYFSIYIL